jgi:hypothetical protein
VIHHLFQSTREEREACSSSGPVQLEQQTSFTPVAISKLKSNQHENEHKLANGSRKSSQGMEADNPSHPMVKASEAKTPRHGENQMDLGRKSSQGMVADKCCCSWKPTSSSSVCLSVSWYHSLHTWNSQGYLTSNPTSVLARVPRHHVKFVHQTK